MVQLPVFKAITQVSQSRLPQQQQPHVDALSSLTEV